MKKIISILICMLMLVILLPVTQAGTDTIKVAEIPRGTTLDYIWDEHDDTDWYTYHYVPDDYWVYSCEPEDQLAPRFSLPDEGVTHRGIGETRINVSATLVYNCGIIFNYINDSCFDWAGVYTLGGNPRFGIMRYKSWTSDVMYDNTSDIDLDTVNVSNVFCCYKVIYNPYVGHVLFKCWETTDVEPNTWDLNVTSASLITTSTVQWGLMAWAGDDYDYFDFYGTVFCNLYYDTRTVGNDKIPVINAPNIDTTLSAIDPSDPANFTEAVSTWNKMDQQTILSDKLSFIGYPIENTYIFTIWNYTVDKLGFLIYQGNDDQNSSFDWISLVFDVDHDHLLTPGDMWFYMDKTNPVGILESYQLDSDGTTWNAVSVGGMGMWYFGQDGLTRFNHTQWLITFDASAVTPGGDLDAFILSGDYLGLAIYGDTPYWCWNNWDETTNTNATTYGLATAGAFNDTYGEYDSPDPGDDDLSYFGDFRFIGITIEEEPDFVDLTDVTSLEDNEYVYAYPSAVWHVYRFALNCEKLTDDNISKVRVPTTVIKQFFFGWFTKTVPVTSVLCYGVNVTGMTKTLITPTSIRSGNYTFDSDDLDTYDVIVIVLNPSSLDTNKWFFKWIYKDEMASAIGT